VGPGYQPDFIFIKITKNPRKNPNWIKTTPEKYLKITKNEK
jgi:hypothetical protein